MSPTTKEAEWEGVVVRNLLMLLTLMVAYVLLRGHPESWPTVVRSCLAVLALVAGIGFWGKRQREKGALVESWRSPGWMDYLAIGAAVLALECLFLVFLSTVPAPLETAAARVEEWLRPKSAATRKEESTSEGGPQRGNWLWNEEQRRPLPRRTNFKQGNRPEIFLQPSTQTDAERMLGSRLYVQAFSLSRYGDAAWSVRPGVVETRVAGNDGWLRMPESRKGEAVSCRVYQGSDLGGQNPLTGLQGLTAARVAEVVSLDSGLQLLPRKDEGYEYDTISIPTTIDDLIEIDVKVSDDAPDVLLAVPDGESGGRIRLEAEMIGKGGGVMERLVGIRNYLRSTLEYSLIIENPDDRDPLENFMFYEKRGHCELFATAAALLARSAGIPSRISYGWVGGTYYEGSRLFVFRAREAHAWTEVWLEGYGWVVFDPTPPSALARSTPGLAAAGEEPPGSEELALDFQQETVSERPAWEIGAGLALIFGLPGIVMLLWRAFSRHDRRLKGTVIGRPTRGGGYVDAFLAKCGERGVKVIPGRTLRGLIEDLEEQPEFARDLVRYHYAVRYEGRERDSKTEKKFTRAIERWH